MLFKKSFGKLSFKPGTMSFSVPDTFDFTFESYMKTSSSQQTEEKYSKVSEESEPSLEAVI